MLNLSQDKIIEIMLEVNFWQEDSFCGVERGHALRRFFVSLRTGWRSTLLVQGGAENRRS